jgi:hypothetical protein
MRSFFCKPFRAVVLILAFSTMVVPVATAAPAGDRDVPSLREGIVRIVRVIRQAFGKPSSNADSLAIPRPFPVLPGRGCRTPRGCTRGPF